MTKSKTNKKQLTELLGMSQSAADRKLRKAIIFEFAQQLGKNVCLECGRPISDPDDFAVVHVEEWTDGPSFFDLGNVAFSHASCRAGRHGRRQGEEMKRIKVTVENSDGQPLRGCMHEGQLYVGGQKDQRYQVRVRNLTGKAVLVVVSVDGRNVSTGEKGSWNDRGFVLKPHGEWVFKGWRQSSEEVAAFRLGAKEDAYSSQMGSAENVGVIGVAVFEEMIPETPVITVKETRYVPVRFPTPRLPPYQPHPWTPRSPYEVGDYPWDYYGTWCSTGGSFTGGTTCSVKLNSTQELGTEYGETLSSSVKDASFLRDTENPVELHLIRYDSVESLERAGIMTGRPSQTEPRAFPESPEVSRGYCQPPSRRRFR